MLVNQGLYTHTSTPMLTEVCPSGQENIPSPQREGDPLHTIRDLGGQRESSALYPFQAVIATWKQCGVEVHIPFASLPDQ